MVWVLSDIVVAKQNTCRTLCNLLAFLLAVWVVLFGLMLFTERFLMEEANSTVEKELHMWKEWASDQKAFKFLERK